MKIDKKSFSVGFILGAIALFLFLIISVSIFVPSSKTSTSTPYTASTSTSTQDLATNPTVTGTVTTTTTIKQLAEMFPTRDDVGTIWKINETQAYDISAAGFVEGNIKRYTKVEDIIVTIVDVKIIKFNSSDYAKTYFDQVVSALKEKGGYDEFLKGSDRYGEKVSYPSGELSEIYYVKGQFYVDIKVTTGLGTETDKTANGFFNIILGKF